MFGVIAGEHGGALRSSIHAMADALRSARAMPGFWIDEAEGFAAFGVSSGLLPEDQFDTQPFLDDKVCFVAEGRVDNRAEIAEALTLPAGDLATHSDTSLLHKSYLKWGKECGRRLVGQYSYCAIHRESRTVIVGTDHIASSMVYFSDSQGCLLVANQLGVLLAHRLLYKAGVDLDATAALITGRSPLDRTAFNDIRALVGGVTLQWQRDRSVQTQRWWNAADFKQIRYSEPRDYIDHAKSVFTTAVKSCLRSSGPISATVSGGLDSSLVAGTAASLLAKRGDSLAMYTAVPEEGLPVWQRMGWDPDESALVGELAMIHRNTRHTLVRPNSVSIQDVVQDTHRYSHTPVRNTANQVWLRATAQQASKNHSHVVLMGEYGNATLSFSGAAVLGRLFSLNPLTAVRLAMSEARTGGLPFPKTLVREVLGRLAAISGARNSAYGAKYLKAHVLERVDDFVFPSIGDIRSRKGHEEFAMFSMRSWTRDELAQQGVQYRSPTSDKRVIEMTLGFPIEALFAGGRERGLARELGKDVVPDSIRFRRRQGSQVPEHCALIALHREQYRSALKDLHKSATCSDNFRLDLVTEDLERLCRGEIDVPAANSIDRLLDVGSFWMGKGL